MLLVTLVRAGSLLPAHVAAASDALRDAGGAPGRATWLDRGDACDLSVDGLPQFTARAAVEAACMDVDVVVQPATGLRRKRLLIADMDSTMITCECVDELADFMGRKPQVAAITEAAMRGELDFTASLEARVALLKDEDVHVIARVLAERVRLTPGAKALVATMRTTGARTILVSGGFTAFADPVGAELGFHRVVANRLLIHDSRLTGIVARPVVDAATKLAELDASGIPRSEALAVGDGANDIAMIAAAGLGIAYHAKPRTNAAADAAVRVGDLTVLLWAQGYRRGDWT